RARAGRPPAARARRRRSRRGSRSRQDRRQLVERLDADRLGGRLLQVAPRTALDVHGRHARGERRQDVVVDAIPHVRDFRRPGAGLLDQPREEAWIRLFEAPPLGRADEVDERPQLVLDRRRRVADDADAVPARPQPRQARLRVGIPLVDAPHVVARRLDPEDLPRVPVRSALGDRRAERRHQRERRHAGGVRDPDPRGGLVDERLADVEDDYVDSDAATRSRSARVVTFSSRSSPSTIVTRPPAASTSAAQSVACNRLLPARSSAARRTGATKPCGVWTVTSSSRATVSTTTPSRTRFTVSLTGRPGTAPSKPSPSAAITRSITA